jgi:hypothetical protein
LPGTTWTEYINNLYILFYVPLTYHQTAVIYYQDSAQSYSNYPGKLRVCCLRNRFSRGEYASGWNENAEARLCNKLLVYSWTIYLNRNDYNRSPTIMIRTDRMGQRPDEEDLENTHTNRWHLARTGDSITFKKRDQQNVGTFLDRSKDPLLEFFSFVPCCDTHEFSSINYRETRTSGLLQVLSSPWPSIAIRNNTTVPSIATRPP